MAGGLLEMLRGAQDGAAVSNLARQFGISDDQAGRALQVLVPEMARGLERNMLDRQGLAQLLEALGSGRHEAYAQNANTLGSAGTVDDGNGILGHILGSKTGSRQLAAYTQQETGLPAGIVKQMLPYVAAMAMGVLFKGGKNVLGDLLGRVTQAGASTGGGPLSRFDMPRLPGGGGGGSTGGFELPPYQVPSGSGGGGGFDLPPFGSGRGTGGSGIPLPGPSETNLPGPSGGGGDNPYGDIGDILRRGGGGAGILATIIRSIFGSMLGRGGGSSSWIGWLVKLVVAKYGWRIVMAIFRGFLGR